MADKNTVMEWYLQNGIDSVIEDMSFDHFSLPPDKKPSSVVRRGVSITTPTSLYVPSSQSRGSAIPVPPVPVFTRPSAPVNDKVVNFADAKEESVDVDKYVKIAREQSNKAKTLDELRGYVENFDGLSIKGIARNTVFADGSPTADILILGEAPGETEDIEGRPFCGQSGKLLDAMFKTIGLPREKLYITNTLFWRPPGNRRPEKSELLMCRPFVEKHIALVNPKLIVYMGDTALKALIKTPLTITKARKNIFEYTNEYLEKPIKTTPTFHPSYLLQSPSKRKDAWGDLLFIKNLIKSLE
jgi:DNA polymerase